MVADAAARYDEHMLAVQLQPALAAVWDIVDRVNHYLVEKEPWKLAKDESKREELASVLYASAETLRILAVLIAPIMPARRRPAVGASSARRPSLDDQRVPGVGRMGTARGGYHHRQGRLAVPPPGRRLRRFRRRFAPPATLSTTPSLGGEAWPESCFT